VCRRRRRLRTDGAPVSAWELLLAIGTASAAAMLVVWAIQLRTGNAGIVDLAWTLLTGGAGVACALLGSGDAMRRGFLGTIAGLWALRLTAHLARRISREPEDGRYAELRERFGARVNLWFLIFFEAQALAVALLAVPFAVAATRAAPLPVWAAVAAAGTAAVAVLGESAADAQLARHRADPANRGKTCRGGLWRYSRHPNYFFEWLHWLAYLPLAWDEGGAAGWSAVVGPLLMLVLVTKVTGIPPAEARALRTRGDDYRAYQRTTSAFVPWPPREDPRS
jgi:steroid 5-alpha reductase family enzyme